jgi:sensor histidine kinase YesM
VLDVKKLQRQVKMFRYTAEHAGSHPRMTTLQILAVTCAGTLVTPAFVFLLNESATAAELRWLFISSAIYANAIGFPAGWIIPRVHRRCARRGRLLKWIILILTLIAVSAIGCIAGTFLLISASSAHWAEFRHLLVASFKLCTFITLVFGFVIGIYESMQVRLAATELKLRTEELERERAIKLATEARLASLEAKVHPHFLFNTLNSISSLIPSQPEKAERLVERMAELLRFALDAPRDKLVPLEKEMKIVRAYLEIEQARLGRRLRYSVEASELSLQIVLPPLSIQTLVENSIKFAIASNREGGEVRVYADCSNGYLCIDVADTGPGFSLDSVPAGHGLKNLQERLAGLFGNAAELALARVNGWTKVSLRVPA